MYIIGSELEIESARKSLHDYWIDNGRTENPYNENDASVISHPQGSLYALEIDEEDDGLVAGLQAASSLPGDWFEAEEGE